MRALIVALATGVLLMAATPTARAQEARGTIQGRVSDQSGGVVPGATVEVANVETRPEFQRQGLARLLWTTACDEAPAFHSLPHHRTAEGDAFAEAVGGDTISEATGFVSVCCICTDVIDEDEDC